MTIAPALCLERLASRHHVSARYIQHLFERAGTSFTSFVLEQRLALAYRLLRDPTHAWRKVSDIAMSAGFVDISYFNRSFKARYAVTPRDIRATMPAAASAAAEAASAAAASAGADGWQELLWLLEQALSSRPEAVAGRPAPQAGDERPWRLPLWRLFLPGLWLRRRPFSPRGPWCADSGPASALGKAPTRQGCIGRRRQTSRSGC